jgi:hypothetical protein
MNHPLVALRLPMLMPYSGRDAIHQDIRCGCLDIAETTTITLQLLCYCLGNSAIHVLPIFVSFVDNGAFVVINVCLS